MDHSHSGFFQKYVPATMQGVSLLIFTLMVLVVVNGGGPDAFRPVMWSVCAFANGIGLLVNVISILVVRTRENWNMSFYYGGAHLVLGGWLVLQYG